MLRIKRVAIENFRSIKKLDFEPSQLCAIVGANNAGKSNVLSALELLLGHRYPTQPALNDEDFYNCDPSAALRISTEFEYEEGGYKNQLRIEFGPDVGSGELKLKYWGEGQSGRYPNRELRDRFSVIRLGVDRGLRQHEPKNKWTLLGRLLVEINDEFKADQERMEEFTNTLEHLRDEVLGTVPSFQELLGVLRDESARQLHRTVDDVTVDLSLHDPWNFYRTLQIVVTECGMTQRADQMGMGLQSSLAIALLRAYAKIARKGRAIIAIEEPELFLHPLAERQFYALMRELAHPPSGRGQHPLQILYTTHSGNFVDFEHFEEIALVRKRNTGGGRWSTTIRQATVQPLVSQLKATGIDATEESVRARLATTFDRSRTEGVFATSVILVEGATEELSLPVYANAMGVNLDAENIAIVNANGKSSMPLLMRVLEQLDIPCFPIFDGDAHINPKNAGAEYNRQILGLSGAAIEDHPDTTIGKGHTVWAEEFERQLRAEVADYTELEAAAGQLLGKRKPVIARHCAQQISARGEVPASVRAALTAAVSQARALAGETTPASAPATAPSTASAGGDVLPF